MSIYSFLKVKDARLSNLDVPGAVFIVEELHNRLEVRTLGVVSQRLLVLVGLANHELVVTAPFHGHIEAKATRFVARALYVVPHQLRVLANSVRLDLDPDDLLNRLARLGDPSRHTGLCLVLAHRRIAFQVLLPARHSVGSLTLLGRTLCVGRAERNSLAFHWTDKSAAVGLRSSKCILVVSCSIRAPVSLVWRKELLDGHPLPNWCVGRFRPDMLR